MWKLGNLDINGRVVLAPMAGITTLGYRKFMAQFGASLFYTEMVSDMGLIYDNEETNSYINYPKDPFPTGTQLFGHDAVSIAKAACIALEKNKNISFFDVNMGCPVVKVTKTGAGSCLMQNPKLCGEIIRSLKAVCNIPVTAKIRLGWDDKNINYLEVIKELTDAGVDMIAIHARTRKDLYGGLPRFELIKDLRKTMSIPLVVSGNIYTLDDAIRAMEITKADAVMVARGGVGNPFLIKQIDHFFKTVERLENPSISEQIKWCIELADYLIEDMGEAKAMRVYRGIASKFFSGFANAKVYKAKLSQELVDKASLLRILDEIKLELGLDM